MKRRSRENVVLSGRLNRIGIEHVALLVFSMAAWGAVSSTILAQKVPVVVGEFATGSFSASNNNHQGIAYNSVDQVYAITDTQDDQVYIVDRKGVRLPGSDFDTTTFGSDLPTGIAFNPVTSEYAITDSTDDQVYIVDTSGGLQGSFDTTAFGSLIPTGITYDPTSGNWAITDSGTDRVHVVNSIGQEQFSFPTCGSTFPTGITWKPGEYHVLDSTADEVFITDLTGACLPDSYDTINFANFGSPQGIGYNADDNVSAIVDNSADKVYPVDDRGEITSQFDLDALGIYPAFPI